VVSLFLNLKTELMIDIKYEVIEDTQNPSFQSTAEWWAGKTHNEEDLLCRTSAFFQNNIEAAFIALHGHQIVAAAALIPVWNKKQDRISYDGHKVVEFASIFIDSAYRGYGIAEELVKLRSKFADERDFLSIAVTRRSEIISIFTKRGWQEMEKLPVYHDLLDQIRNCTCQNGQKPFIGERCNVCPLLGKSVWIKP